MQPFKMAWGDSGRFITVKKKKKEICQNPTFRLSFCELSERAMYPTLVLLPGKSHGRGGGPGGQQSMGSLGVGHD